jgi:transcriptional regulator with XRE-family HTH domain
MRVRNTTAGDGPSTDETKPTRGPHQARGPRRVPATSSVGGERTKETGGTSGKATPARQRRQGELPPSATARPARGGRRTTPPAAMQPEMTGAAPAAPPPSAAEQTANKAATGPTVPSATEASLVEITASLVLPQEPSTPDSGPGSSPEAPQEPDEAEFGPATNLTATEEPDEAEFESDAALAVPDGPDESTPGGQTRGNRGWRRQKDRAGSPRSNALGVLIEQRFADPSSSVRSYSELERHSGISREALSRYVTPRADRRRSPTVDTLAAIADAMHISLEQMCRAAVASAQGITLPSETQQHARDELIAPLCATLTDEQFAAVVELLRQMQPRARSGS